MSSTRIAALLVLPLLLTFSACTSPPEMSKPAPDDASTPPPAAISFTVDDAPLPADAEATQGTLPATRIHNLRAYVDKMPRIGDPSTPLIVTFEVDMATPCDFPVLTRSNDKGLETYRVHLNLARTPGICAQVITRKRVHYKDPQFAGPFKQFSLELTGGESTQVDIGEVH